MNDGDWHEVDERNGPDETVRVSIKAVLALLLALATVVLLGIMAIERLGRDYDVISSGEGVFAALAVPSLIAVFLALSASLDIRDSGGRKVGLLLAHTAMTIGGACLLGAFVVVTFEPRGGRSPALRLRSHQRSLATAIEAYFVDHGAYPVWSTGSGTRGAGASYNYWVGRSRRGMTDPAGLPTFAMPNPTATSIPYLTLTSPMSYITTYPTDPFAPIEGATFVYWSVNPGETDPSGTIVGAETGFGWILVSSGPDRIYDIPVDYDVYDPATKQPSERLLTGANRFGRAFTYDPTNGVISSGDIWRVRQE
jgi:hypothetical protein